MGRVLGLPDFRTRDQLSSALCFPLALGLKWCVLVCPKVRLGYSVGLRVLMCVFRSPRSELAALCTIKGASQMQPNTVPLYWVSVG